jgi:hypothetical protein
MTSGDLIAESRKFSGTLARVSEFTNKILKYLNYLHSVETVMIALPRSRLSINMDKIAIA